MRKITLYHALLFVLIVGIGVLVWQTVLLRHSVTNQTATLEQAVERASAKQLEATQKPMPNPRTREAQENAMPVYVVNMLRLSEPLSVKVENEPLEVKIEP
jgi:ABC-type phosphate/phosphonate transport system permease subunit